MDAETNELPLLTRLTHIQHYGYVPFSVRCDVVEAIDTITRLTAERDEARATLQRISEMCPATADMSVAHMTREEAMRAAALAHYADPERQGISPIATAGADAELARVVEWLRGAHYYQPGHAGPATRALLGKLADAIEARAHWKDDQ